MCRICPTLIKNTPERVLWLHTCFSSIISIDFDHVCIFQVNVGKNVATELALSI